MRTRKLPTYAVASFAFLLFQGTATDSQPLGCGGSPPCSCSYRSAFDLCVTCCGDTGQAICPTSPACKPGLHYDGSTAHCEQPCSWGTSSFGNCCGDVGQVICDVLSGYGSCMPGLHYDGSTAHCELPCSWGTSSFGNCCGDVDQPWCDVLSGYDACMDGLAQGIGNCRTPRVAGESCGPDYPCKDGTGCTLTVVGGSLGYQCVLDEGTDVVGDPDVCKAFYSSDLSTGAANADLVLNFGWGANAVAGVGATIEEGVFYTQDGKYGCYITNCYGYESNLGVSAYVASGQTLTFDDFKGHSFVFNELAGIDVVSFIASQGWNSHDDFAAGKEPVSSGEAVAFGLDVIPISVGASECDTVTQVVVGEDTPSPPVALCRAVSVAADATCVASASVDAGSYSATAGNSVTLTQSPAGPYAIGVTPVTLTATDSNGKTATCSGSVEVRDLTPPTLACPASLTADSAPGRCEAEVAYPTPSASDFCSAVSAASDPPSGSTFPVGTTTVSAQATDGHDNTSTCAFTVTVRDAEPPVLAAPPDQVLDATGPDGAVVTYDPFQAADNCAVVSTTSAPASGSTFAIDAPGEVTLVTGVATDAAGNVGTASFSVHVKGAGEQIEDLLVLVEGLSHHEELEQDVLHARRALDSGRTGRACNALGEVLEELSEDGDRREDACEPTPSAAIVGAVTRIRAVLACPSGECPDDDLVARSP